MEIQPTTKSGDLRKFGLGVGLILLALTAYQWKFHDRLWEWVAGVGGVFLVLGLIFPRALGAIYRPWMWVGEKIGFVMNRIILTLFYFFFFTPIALIRRVFHRDPLHLKWDAKRPSYFEPKTIQPPEGFETLF